MVSESKKQEVKELKTELKKWSAVGAVNMFKLPGKQLFQIREKLKGRAVILMVKKRLIVRALNESGFEGLDKHIQGEPALLFSNENPFKLAGIIQKSKSMAMAREGDIAPLDIIVPAGPTGLVAGPAIGEFQRAKIPSGVEDGKISVKQDTLVAKEGDVISKGLADIMAKLGIEPMEIGLNLLAVWESGTIYPKDILFIPAEKYLDDIRNAVSRAFNLTADINYYTPLNIELFLGKAHKEAFSLAVEANLLTSETLEPLLAKAYKEAMVLKEKVKDTAPKEDKPEEKPAEEKEAVKQEPEEKPGEKETPAEGGKEVPVEEPPREPAQEEKKKEPKGEGKE